MTDETQLLPAREKVSARDKARKTAGAQLRAEEPLTFSRIAIRRLRRDRLTIAAAATLLVLVLLSLFANVVSSRVLGTDPNQTDILRTFEGPSAENWLGTDQLGRDQLARLLHGGRVSLAIGFSGAFLAMTLGITIGLAAGFFGSVVDDIIMWIINTLVSIPQLFLLLIIVAVFEPSPLWLTLIFGFLGWTGVSRFVRGEVFAVRERDYVLAARSLGATPLRIITRHVLPNIIPLVFVITAREIGLLILAESALSFLGLGVQPPTATWGNMLSKAQQYFVLGPHLVVFPGVLISITVLCLYILGDGLRDALDPRI